MLVPAPVPAFLHPFSKPTRTDFTTIVRGEGALLWTDDGRELVDGMASLWYCAAGHGRRAIGEAVAAQIAAIEAYSCFEPFTNEPAERVTARLAAMAPDRRRPRVPVLLGLGGGRLGDEAGPRRPHAGRPTRSAR